MINMYVKFAYTFFRLFNKVIIIYQTVMIFKAPRYVFMIEKRVNNFKKENISFNAR